VDAGAALSGVEAETGLGLGVVGDLCAAVVVDRGVGFAGGDDGDAAGDEQRTEADAEGDGDGFFWIGDAGRVFEGAAGVVATVRGIEDDDEAVGGGGRDLGEGRDGEGEEKN
jgi:hypothetical protein